MDFRLVLALTLLLVATAPVTMAGVEDFSFSAPSHVWGVRNTVDVFYINPTISYASWTLDSSLFKFTNLNTWSSIGFASDAGTFNITDVDTNRVTLWFKAGSQVARIWTPIETQVSAEGHASIIWDPDSKVTIVTSNKRGTVELSWATTQNSVLVVYDDAAAFWTPASGGTGSIDVSIADQSGTVHSGTSALRYQIVSGSKAWVNVYHSYASHQDWSGYDALAVWWYDQNTGATMDIYISGPDWNNRFTDHFVDDFTGWQKVTLPVTGFESTGSPSWSAVGDIYIATATPTPTTWYLDAITMEPDTYALTVNTVGSGSVTKTPDSAKYVDGSYVKLTATPDDGWVFSGWSGNLSGSSNPATLVMEVDKTVTATFVKPPVLVVYDDAAAFWTPASGGTGSIDVSIADQSGTVHSGTSALRYQIVSGSKVWVNVYHSYASHQDWSGYDALAVWWYGQNTGATMDIYISGSDWNNRFTDHFVDDFTGWQKVTLPVTGFESTGSPSWSAVGDIYIATATPTPTTWYLDAITMEPDTYALTVNTVGSGSVTKTPDSAKYVDGSYVKLTATPDDGWVFSGWSGNLSGSSNPATLVMEVDKTVTATFVKPPVLVVYDDAAAFWTPASGGTGSIDVSIADQSGTVHSGTSALRYQIVSGSKAWVNVYHSYASHQDWSGYDALAVWWYGQNTGATMDIYISGPDWNNRFTDHFVDDFTGWQKVTLPVTGFESTGSPSWSAVGDIYIATATPTPTTWYLDAITMEPDTYALTVNTVGSGSVTKTPDSAKYVDGSYVKLTATPDDGWVFSGWSGNLSGSSNPATLVMEVDKTVTATFVKPPVLVVYDDAAAFWTPASGGTGSIDVSIADQSGTVHSGTSALRYQIVSGSKAWVNVYHSYASHQDWSGYDALAVWWYGQNTGATMDIYISGPDWNNRFTDHFVDDFTGWQKVTLPVTGFESTGSPSWSAVGDIYIATATPTPTTWYLDAITMEKS